MAASDTNALVPALSPSAEAPARVSAPPGYAGGVPAIVQTVRFAAGQLGVVRATRALLKLNQVDGFDCPGCAWPEPAHRATAEFCENGAKAIAEEATTRRLGAGFFAEWPVARLAAETDHWLSQQGRLTEPLVLRAGADRYAPVSWDEAFALIASRLRSLPSPDEAIFYTSGRASNEAAFLYQLFARQFGTNNLPDCSNMCHESSGAGLGEALGVGKGTVQLDDFERADAIFVVGQNPGTNHPRMLTTLQAAARRGARIVTVNPLHEPGTRRFKHPQEVSGWLGGGTPLETLHVPVRINGDVAFFKGVMKEMLDADDRSHDVLDRAFIAEHTSGFEAFERDLRAERWDAIVASAGVSRALIRAAADVALASRATIVTWAMGLTQHKNAVGNVQAIVDFLLLQGNVGRPGAGPCPVRGHSNVQGDRTMGIWEKMPDGWLDRLGAAFGFSPPRRHGFDTVNAIHAMREGRAGVFFALGGNFLSAAPDTAYTADALRRCALTVQVSTKLSRAHLVTGREALILPCLGRTERDHTGGKEQFVTVEDSMGVVHASRGVLAPASQSLRSEVAIVAGLARATLGATTAVDWEAMQADYDLVREAIERVVPGFERFNERVRAPGGFTLPNAARERTFGTATGKARFLAHPLPRHDLAPGQLLLMTVRSHDQFNTTIYGLDDRYRGIRGGRRVVFVSAEDVRALGFAEGDVVDLVSHFEGERRVARAFRVVPFEIPRGCAAAYFPEANALVPARSVADVSNTPASKSVVVTLERALAAAGPV